jgi:hypothetical protein
MKPWTEFLDYVAPDMPNCPNPMMVHQIRQAGIEFCRATRRWQVDATITVAPGDTDKTIAVPAETVIVDVLELRDAEREILPKTRPWLIQNLGPAWESLSGEIDYYTVSLNKTVRLVRTPTVSGTLQARIAVAPLRSNTAGVEDWFFEQYVENIAIGARARLFSMSAKPWSNPKRAEEEYFLWQTLIGQADGQAAQDDTMEPLRTTAYYR